MRLRWGSLLLLGTGLVATAVVPAERDDHPDVHPTALPYLRESSRTFYVQVLLLVLLVVAVARSGPGSSGASRPGSLSRCAGSPHPRRLSAPGST